MSLSSLNVASVAAITVICFFIGMVIKVTPYLNNRYIPIACGGVGAILGIVALYTHLPDFPATDPLTAAAVGIVSGMAATGANQVCKQLKNGPE